MKVIRCVACGLSFLAAVVPFEEVACSHCKHPNPVADFRWPEPQHGPELARPGGPVRMFRTVAVSTASSVAPTISTAFEIAGPPKSS